MKLSVPIKQGTNRSADCDRQYLTLRKNLALPGVWRASTGCPGGSFSSATGDSSLGFSGRRSGLTPGAGVVETFTYQAHEVEVDDGPDGPAVYRR